MEDQFKFPDRYKPKSKVKKLTDASLSSMIKKHIESNGGICDIIKTSGTWRKGKEEVVSKGMFSVTIQKTKSHYTPSNATKGASDNSIVLVSKSGTLICWKCENKIGADKMSADQIVYKNKVINLQNKVNKGLLAYSVVSDFEDFLKQYEAFMNI